MVNIIRPFERVRQIYPYWVKKIFPVYVEQLDHQESTIRSDKMEVSTSNVDMAFARPLHICSNILKRVNLRVMFSHIQKNKVRIKRGYFYVWRSGPELNAYYVWSLLDNVSHDSLLFATQVLQKLSLRFLLLRRCLLHKHYAFRRCVASHLLYTDREARQGRRQLLARRV